ncbi:MAG TPA: cobaltochelatase subunit CobN [Vicinamibacterales bacterium]|nr:cobaltochelatase subunit CobN [Vicinamibacterales bacterium]
MSTFHRQRVVRADGRAINVVQRRAHLSYCFSGCCCGRTERGYAAVPSEAFKREWLDRKLRNVVHLTKAGCLGPCALANVASLVFDGHAVWFHSVNTAWHVRLIFDYIETMIRADRFVAPPSDLTEHVFNYYDWDVRPKTASPSLARSDERSGVRMALLSHADTDLLALRHACGALPPDLSAVGVSLLRIQTGEQLAIVLEGDLAPAQIIVLRLHGELTGVSWFVQLRDWALQRRVHLVVVSGTGEPRSDFARVSTVGLDVVDAVRMYLTIGGERNMGECLKFLSDRLLLTGFGSAPPAAGPEHGVYLRDVEDATMEDWLRTADASRPTAAVLFYRAHVTSGNLAFVDALVEALEDRGLNALAVFTSSLRAREGGIPAALQIVGDRADVIISTLSFALGDAGAGSPPVLERLGIPIIQAMTSGMPREAWEVSHRGLNPIETAINVAIPEFDGRIVTVPMSFKDRAPEAPGLYAPHDERIGRIAGIARAMARLRHQPRGLMRVAFVLTNSSAKASQVGNAVGLDAPASLLTLLRAMRRDGYAVEGLPSTSDELMADLLARGSYDDRHPLDPGQAHRFSRSQYLVEFDRLPAAARARMEAWWGVPAVRGDALRSADRRIDKKMASKASAGAALPTKEPWSDEHSYLFAAMSFGHALVALQPPRGYGMNPDAIYHTPDLPPTHQYVAFYRWLGTAVENGGWGADAIVHVGKHGTLEWLPGKGVGLSNECFPDALLGDLPLVYPFIVNDPGEGSQAKRRAHAVIVDHLMPAMTNADTYGPLASLNDLVNEYYALEKLEPAKLPIVQQQIWDLIQQTQLHADLDLRAMLTRDHGDHTHDWDDELTPEGVPASLAEMSGNDVAHLIEDIDGYLCELGTAQIRDGLHVLGVMPPLPDTLRALTRLPNGPVVGLQSALADAFGLDLPALLAAPGARFDDDRDVAGTTCRTHADAIEHTEALARELYLRLEGVGFQERAMGEVVVSVLGRPSDPVVASLRFACRTLVPALEQVTDEVDHVLDALAGRYVPPGPAGAPTRGMAHILPTGRNFFAVDPRAVPSQAAWRVGEQLACALLDRYLAEEGRYPEMIGLGAWGTAQMRTQGDDIAEVLALLGVEPVWDPRSRRIQDLAVVPLERLGRPRIDVTLRISGFFRDAFPHLITLVDRAVELVVLLDEPIEQNYPRKHYLAEVQGPGEGNASLDDVEARARYRIFGAKPGTYGAGIQQLLETRHWETEHDFAAVFVEWGGYAYGREADGVDARDVFVDRLRSVEVAVHNQDNREHDIFDSDDYYQFHGGMIATVRSLTGRQPKTYFGDSSRPDAARVRDLREEALRVYRSRVVNPKWIESIRRHGYKGGLELTTTVDYIFGFDATAHVAPDLIYEGLAAEYALSPDMQRFLEQSNPWALHAIADRLLEAAGRGLWEHPDPATLESLRDIRLKAESFVEARGDAPRARS